MVLWLMWSALRPTLLHGDQTRKIVFVRDITDRRQAENEVREAKEYLENILENSADPIGIVDQRGRIIQWNKASEQAFGYSFGELEGNSSFELYADRNATPSNAEPIAPGRLGPRLRDPFEEKGWEHCPVCPVHQSLI